MLKPRFGERMAVQVTVIANLRMTLREVAFLTAQMLPTADYRRVYAVIVAALKDSE